MKFYELEEGKIYLSQRGYRVARIGEFLYVLCTGNFIVEQHDKDGFDEYPFPTYFPKSSLLYEEFIKGPSAVQEQIKNGRAKKEIIYKSQKGVRNLVKRKFEAFRKRMIKEKALLYGSKRLNNERKRIEEESKRKVKRKRR